MHLYPFSFFSLAHQSALISIHIGVNISMINIIDNKINPSTCGINFVGFRSSEAHLCSYIQQASISTRINLTTVVFFWATLLCQAGYARLCHRTDVHRGQIMPMASVTKSTLIRSLIMRINARRVKV